MHFVWTTASSLTLKLRVMHTKNTTHSRQTALKILSLMKLCQILLSDLITFEIHRLWPPDDTIWSSFPQWFPDFYLSTNNAGGIELIYFTDFLLSFPLNESKKSVKSHWNTAFPVHSTVKKFCSWGMFLRLAAPWEHPSVECLVITSIVEQIHKSHYTDLHLYVSVFSNCFSHARAHQ